jgi:hypothetical protein
VVTSGFLLFYCIGQILLHFDFVVFISGSRFLIISLEILELYMRDDFMATLRLQLGESA